MGIGGLLLNLKDITEHVHIKEYAGKKVAIDTYVWLHRGSYSCASQLCQNIPTDKYVEYCMHRVRMLRHWKVKPLLVFDGAALPAKKRTEANRFRSRVHHQQLGMECMQQGKTKEAREHFVKAVDISPDVAYRLIAKLKEEDVDFIVAPYEADAQLAFLSQNGIVDCVVSEDSDLLVYGCRRVMFKMDDCGKGQQICLDRLHECRSPIDLSTFNQKMFRQMCILSGCDYLASIPGIGLKKAYSLIKAHGNATRGIYYLKNRGSAVPENYEQLFEQAEFTFLHQRVWDPVQLQLAHLTTLPEILEALEENDRDFLGPLLSREQAQGVATGHLHPETKLIYAPPQPATAASTTKPMLRKSLPLPAPVPNVPRIQSFFSPQAKQSEEVKNASASTVSPYFAKKISPPSGLQKSKFTINRTPSSPTLQLPRPQSPIAKAPKTPTFRMNQFHKSSAAPSPAVDASNPNPSEEEDMNGIQGKENRIMMVTSRFFSKGSDSSELDSSLISAPTPCTVSTSLHAKFRLNS